jgi:outer membrane protein assembly factor BamB
VALRHLSAEVAVLRLLHDHLGLAGALAALAVAGSAAAADWPQPNGDLAGTRAVAATAISSRTVGHLRVLWRFRLPGRGYSGSFASSPLVLGRTVYVQDLSSSVYALDARSGRLRWAFRAGAPSGGPNGIAAAGRRIFGATDTTAFALDRATGRRLWSRRLERPAEQFVDVAPLAARGLVFLATAPVPPGGRGALYALDAASGRVRWRFDTIRGPWPTSAAGGGGAWFPPSLSPDGRAVYFGIANPGPWGGTKTQPNGAVFRGRALYTDSLVALDSRTGRLLRYDQVTRHDVRDYDFEASPIVTATRVYGAGKAGRVVAWDRRSGRRLWARAVGTHLHDLGPLPARPTRVCPGLLGGVETPMALTRGRLFVPVVELCMTESATTVARLTQRDPAGGEGVLVALDAAGGRPVWTRRFGSPLFGCATVARDVVFAPTYDGWLHALSALTGRELWRARARAGINGCPAVGAGLVLVGAGAPHPAYRRPVPEVVAFGVSRSGP